MRRTSAIGTCEEGGGIINWKRGVRNEGGSERRKEERSDEENT